MQEFSDETWAGRAAVRRFESFPVGSTFKHQWGKTITDAETIEFATSCLLHEPYLFNREYARSLGHPDIVVAPMLVYATVLGLSVQDLSEEGGPFLGSKDVRFHATAYPGVTVTASSRVVESRLSARHEGFGVVSWHTEGVNQHGELLISFTRTNLVARGQA